jgi:hypothetical protein
MKQPEYKNQKEIALKNCGLSFILVLSSCDRAVAGDPILYVDSSNYVMSSDSIELAGLICVQSNTCVDFVKRWGNVESNSASYADECRQGTVYTNKACIRHGIGCLKATVSDFPGGSYTMQTIQWNAADSCGIKVNLELVEF